MRLLRLHYRTDGGSAEVWGFDHSTAWFTWFGVSFGAVPWFIPLALDNYGWRHALLGSAVAWILTAVAMLPFRFRVLMTSGLFALERSWGGVIYRSAIVTAVEDLRFEIWGTGDCGEEGGWPGSHYCEVWGAPGDEWRIGSPAASEQLAEWLTAQKRRLSTPQATETSIDRPDAILLTSP